MKKGSSLENSQSAHFDARLLFESPSKRDAAALVEHFHHVVGDKAMPAIYGDEGRERLADARRTPQQDAR
jgi:hypothetical protein